MKFLSRVFNQLKPRRVTDEQTPQRENMNTGSYPSSFYHDELERALGEQCFGIHSYKVLNTSSPRQSSAAVITLEGQRLNVILTGQGYSVESKRSDGTDPTSTVTSNPPRPQIYETIECLLLDISPLYASRRQEHLFLALQSLSRSTYHR
ncbi:hypothetical protein FA15DRAFT_666206 [Coprinopsis marcescibilis]|uniref:GSKIP domain-containing protein n=1 Tax=Coprinopsis marcescibilis TaxID=230819 RepID=A0A5C3L6G2_COPMA|nr:hypothetical protein FA15DRAFT_666206 [Coprinopsis marcescibilis]